MMESHIANGYIEEKPHDELSLSVAVVDCHNGFVPTLHSSSKSDHRRVLTVARSEFAVFAAMKFL